MRIGRRKPEASFGIKTMGFLGWIFFIIFGGRLIRFLIRSFSNSSKEDPRQDEYRSFRENTEEEMRNRAEEQARQEAYRKWQEELYRRYRESQYQYQRQQQQGGYYQQNGYQNTYQPRPSDPKLDEVRRMYGHPKTLEELDDKQRELRKKYHPDNYNGDSSMFILVDQVHDELERMMR